MMDVLPQRIHDFAWDIFIALKQTFSQLAFCGIQEEDEEYSAVLAKSQRQIFFFQLEVHIFVIMSQCFFLLLIRNKSFIIYLLFIKVI